MVCARTAFTLRRGQQRGHDRVSDLVLDDVGRLAIPIRMNDHLDVGDVRQRIKRDAPHRPDSCQHKQQRSGENKEAVAGAPVDPAADHCMPPSASTESCFCASVWPFFCGQHSDLPGSSHLHLAGTFVDASAFVAEGRDSPHRGHTHRRHRCHEERDGNLCAGDGLAVRSVKLHSKVLLPLCGVGEGVEE